MSIELEKDARSGECDPFVPVVKGVVSNDRVRVGGGKVEQIDVRVRTMMARAGQGRVQQTFIADPGGTAVFRKQSLVDRENGCLGEPAWLRVHFARSRSAFR